MNTTEIIIATMWAASLGCIGWYAVQAARRITYVTLADGRQQERRLPLFFRLLLPLVPNVAGLFDRPGFERSLEATERKLISAGFDGLLSSREFLALRILTPLILGPLFIVAVHLLLIVLPGDTGGLFLKRAYIFYTLLMAWLIMYPSFKLRQALVTRHRQIERALPFVLDLLTLSIEAGLDFMAAIQRIIERRKIDPLGEELIRVFREVQLGKMRRAALQAMSERVGQADVRTVMHALVQADELGVSIGSILRIQADQMRGRRFQRAEKLANETPVKMLFPLICFIFPAVFLVLLGPVIVQLIQQGF